MFKIIEKYPIWTICLLVAIMLMPNINSLGVTIMEARNFITAREMVSDSNWLLTTMNGEARYQKPPLPTWLTAISGLIFGFKSLFGLRLPTIFMIMVLGSYVYKLSNNFLNESQSFINALITITSFYVIGIIIEAPWDIFTHGFMLIAIFHLFILFEKENNFRKHTLLAGLFFGLSFLSKGPISLYALLLPFLIAYGFTFKYSKIKSKVFPIFGVLIFGLVIGCWWYLYVRLQNPETFSAITKKETGNWSSYNVRPFYYYWSFFTQSGLWTIPAFISLLYPYLKTRVSNLKAYKFSLFWTFFTIILLSVIPEKKSRYLMPVLIPLALNIGFYIEYLIQYFKTLKNKRETIPVYFNFGLIAGIGMLFPLISFIVLKDNVSGYWVWYILASVASFSVGILILIQLKKKNIKNVFLLTVLFFSSLLIFALPLSKPLTIANNPISNLKAETKQKNLKVYGFNHVSPEMIWQYGDKVPAIKIDNSFKFPEEGEFGMLANTIDQKDEKILKSLYNIEKITTYDLNFVPIGSKKHKDRLLNHFYILTKK